MLNVDKIFILHYPKLTERKQRLIDAPELNGNCIEWITDYDPDSLDHDAVRYVDLPDAYKSKYLPECRLSYKKMSASEISLCAKHRQVYRKIVDGNIQTALILEDDVIFHKNFVSLFNSYMIITPQDWDIIFPGDGCAFHFLKTLGSMHAYLKSPPLARASDSYVVRYDTALRFVNNFNEVFLPSDHQINYMMNFLNMKCYWWEPTIVTQGSQNNTYQSAIQHGCV